MPTTLLAVDDSVTMRRVLEMTFAGEQDVRVVTADNVDGALAKFRSERAALVLADLTLDGQGGYGLCSRIKAESPSTPVILLSSKQQAYEPAKGSAAHADDFVEKPFDTQTLIDKVRKLLGKTVEPARTTGAFPAAPAAGGPAQQPARSPFASTVVGQPLPAARPGAAPPSVGPRPTAGASASAQGGRGPGGAAMPPARGPMPTRVGQPAPPALHAQAAPGGAQQNPGAAHTQAAARAAHAAPGSASPSPGAVAPRFEGTGTRGVGTAQPMASGARPGSAASLPSAISPRSAEQASPVASASAASPGAAASPTAASPQSAVATPQATPASPVASAAASAMGANGPVAHRLSDLGLSEGQVTAVLALSREVVERVVWEVVPVLAETMIREEIKRLTSDS